jgi:hypothetical protein
MGGWQQKEHIPREPPVTKTFLPATENKEFAAAAAMVAEFNNAPKFHKRDLEGARWIPS